MAFLFSALPDHGHSSFVVAVVQMGMHSAMSLGEREEAAGAGAVGVGAAVDVGVGGVVGAVRAGEGGPGEEGSGPQGPQEEDTAIRRQVVHVRRQLDVADHRTEGCLVAYHPARVAGFPPLESIPGVTV